MRVVIVNSEDRRGGAARAAHRLHRALRAAGVDCRMLVQIKHGDEDSVVGPETVFQGLAAPFRPALDLLPILAYRQRNKETFYPGWLPDRMRKRVDKIAPDIVHLHWITGGTLNVRSLRSLQRPLVWTLHDMWAFTGGCHYDGDCGRYVSGCGQCPVLGSSHELDLSRLGWRRKSKAYRQLPLHIVTPSRWLGDLARSSPLLGELPVSVIPNAIDTEMFSPVEKSVARQILRLPPDRKIVLFGALRATSETRKGYKHLDAALENLAAQGNHQDTVAVIIGASQAAGLPEFGMERIFLGTLSDDVSLALAYSAADVFVAPSQQENLSNAVMEALACGTPVVAFRVGGMPDMITHGEHGFLAEPLDTAGLANGIAWVLEDAERRAALSRAARKFVVENFDSLRIARRHADLYDDLRHRIR